MVTKEHNSFTSSFALLFETAQFLNIIHVLLDGNMTIYDLMSKMHLKLMHLRSEMFSM